VPTVVLRPRPRRSRSPDGLEAQEAFGALAAQFPRFDIAEDTLRYVPNIVSRSLRGLHVTFRDQ
jgi:hypothetical protein